MWINSWILWLLVTTFLLGTPMLKCWLVQNCMIFSHKCGLIHINPNVPISGNLLSFVRTNPPLPGLLVGINSGGWRSWKKQILLTTSTIMFWTYMFYMHCIYYIYAYLLWIYLLLYSWIIILLIIIIVLLLLLLLLSLLSIIIIQHAEKKHTQVM